MHLNQQTSLAGRAAEARPGRNTPCHWSGTCLDQATEGAPTRSARPGSRVTTVFPMAIVVVLVATVMPAVAFAQSKTDRSASRESAVENSDDPCEEILGLLRAQAECWNRGDIDGFMETYWKSENLTFSGGGKTTRGWTATRDRYKARYPRDKMGTLKFDQLETSLLSDGVALVLGRWYLDQQGTKVEGNFTLVLKKFDDGWKIVHDHSSTLEK